MTLGWRIVISICGAVFVVVAAALLVPWGLLAYERYLAWVWRASYGWLR